MSDRIRTVIDGREYAKLEAQLATVTAERDEARREVERLSRDYHKIMYALRRSRQKHGDCKSGKRYGGRPMACTACMANLELDQRVSEYKGAPVKLAAALNTEGKQG